VRIRPAVSRRQVLPASQIKFPQSADTEWEEL
jgi:hypothetical protein